MDNTYPDRENYVCPDCAHEWPLHAPASADDASERVVKDANGNPLADGDAVVLIKDLSEQCGVEAALEILKMKPLPDGAFITNDFSAAVCMQTLKENDIRIPGDIAIVGFNNDAISKIVEPQLTTIHYPGIDMGEIAARNLINHLKGLTNIRHTNTIVVSSQLIVRKSSLKKQNHF